MSRRAVWLTAILAGVSIACAADEPAGEREVPRYLVTIHPLAVIVSPVAGDRARVTTLLAAGASPHAYEPSPSDVRAAYQSVALFFGAPHLDEWAAALDAPVRIALLDLLPEDARLPLFAGDRGEPLAGADPHFWMDPLAVRMLLSPLADTLCALDPGGCGTYTANAREFSEELTALDAELRELLGPLSGRGVLLAHPFLGYFLDRYDMTTVDVIESVPGKEPSPAEIERIVHKAREGRVSAIITLPQLPPRAAAVVSESTGIPLVRLDPIGGVAGRISYVDLLRFNAWTLAQAIR